LTSEADASEGSTAEKVEVRGIVEKDILDEMKTSYLNYSMSVIVGRALPDARDGLKPVHRRILHSMNESGMVHGKPYKKSARIVGDVLGKYHPHGDSAVYDALVRMAQPFSLRYPLVDGQGNFGSVDGDSAAAMRYTESRTARFAMEMLEDIDKDTVDMLDNYDGSLKEPSVLPSRAPNLLINGSSGIAVGMATNMPPHNLNEVVDGVVEYMGDPSIDTLALMKHVKAPDFPTGGIVYGTLGVYEAYDTGRGKVTIRAKAEIEEKEGEKNRIVVTEIPYMVNKSNMLQKIAELVKAKVFEGISDIRDESDKDGLRVVFELKRDAIPEVVLNQLYKHSDLQTTFGIINLAIVDGQPKVLNLSEIIGCFVDHRRDVVRRRTEFDLNKAKERLHLVQGLIIALDNIDEVVKLIRGSRDADSAREGLQESFELSELQAKAILDMRLQKLTSLEGDNVRNEGEELKATISDLQGILDSKERLDGIIVDELLELKEKYGDERRTDIEENAEEIDLEDLIMERDILVTITNTGYIKRIDLDTYKTQNRGGKGLRGMGFKEEDWVVDMFVCSTHDYILFFTSRGRVFWLKGYSLPSGSRHSRGKPIINLLPNLDDDEEVRAHIKITDFDVDKYLMFATRKGTVKRTSLESYSRPRSTGIKAILLNDGDELIGTSLCDDTDEVVLATAGGMANRFRVADVRAMGRNATGVRGMRLKDKNDLVVSMAVIPGSDQQAEENGDEDEMEEAQNDDSPVDPESGGPILLSITENGFGKRAYAYNYRLTKRGSAGVINIHRDYIEETGKVVRVLVERPDSEVLLISQNGMVIRTSCDCIRLVNRAGKGVIVMRLEEKDKVMGVALVDKLEGEDDACDMEEGDGVPGAKEKGDTSEEAADTGPGK